MLRTKSIASTSLLALVLLGGQAAAAQQQQASATVAGPSSLTKGSVETVESNTAAPNPAADASETAELRRLIAELEERLAKVEARKGASEAPGPAGQESAPKEVVVAEVANNAPDAKPTAPAWEDGFRRFFKEVEVSGFVDGYYGYNFNKPAGRTTQLRSFETRNNEFALNLIEIVLEKKPDPDESRFGFRLDLNFGPAADLTHGAEFGNRDTYKFFQQAYVSYLAPVGSGLQLDFGKFVTANGAEVIESKDNWNYTRGILFTLGPFFHAGARAKYAFNSKVAVMGMVVNGWDTTEDNNGGKSAHLQLALTPTSKFALYQNYMVGPEELDSIPVPAGREGDHFVRHFFDTVAVYNVNPKLSLMANYDYGIERQRLSGNKVHFQGLAAYLRWMPTAKLAFSPRFEWYDDHDGARTGVAQELKEVTFTGEYRFRPNVIAKFDVRNDWSNTPFFTKSNSADPLSKNQTTVTAGFVYSFSTREQ